jgi:hypothetical protein
VVPVAAVASQSGRLDSKDGADLASAHLGDQSLKSRTLHQSGSRAAQIIVNHSYIPKPQFSSSIRKAILTALTFVVVQHLAGR